MWVYKFMDFDCQLFCRTASSGWAWAEWAKARARARARARLLA